MEIGKKKKKSLLEKGAIDEQWSRDVEQTDIDLNLKVVLSKMIKCRGP